MIFCDISKAFDRVWHKGLIFKLRQYGIDGDILNWLSNYLLNRHQKVFVNSTFSSEKITTAGVPQGSVLGPLLFLIYVNDIADNLLSITRLFADDSSLSISSSNMNFIENTLNTDLHSLQEWSHKWLIKFNPDKTEVMFFSLNDEQRPSLFFENTQLTYVKTHKHLGLTLSEDGKWHEHINNIMTSASNVLSSMQSLKFKLKRNTLNQIYLSYMRPILEYASTVWDGCNENDKHSLEKMQYEAARVVTGLTRSVSIDRLLREIGWVSLSDRRIMQKLIIVYKAHQNNVPSYLLNLFPNSVANSTPYFLRNDNNYVTIARRTQIFAKSFIPSSIELWNNLDDHIRHAASLNIFKSRLKEIYKPHTVPKYFVYGDRSLSVYHARIRNECSNLNADLCKNHLRDNSLCSYCTSRCRTLLF